MTTTQEDTITADKLMDIIIQGMSGGDIDNGMFQIEHVRGKELNPPIRVPQEAMHLAEACVRTKLALDMMLTTGYKVSKYLKR